MGRDEHQQRLGNELVNRKLRIFFHFLEVADDMRLQGNRNGSRNEVFWTLGFFHSCNMIMILKMGRNLKNLLF